MDYKLKGEDIEDLLLVCRFATPETQNTWTPCIKRLKAHEITPLWAASVMYLILDSYTGAIEDKNQSQFVKETLKIFNIMKNNGHEYISKVSFSEEQD
jgi:hypothetical protein